MEDFSFNGIHYKPVEVPIKQGCDGCVFFINRQQTLCIENCTIVPHCMKGGKVCVFVEASQNALQQEQEESS